jgi:hypothetical protein
MTIRTGEGGRYRYYACSTKARQGPTGCEGMATVLDRRQKRSERRREHIAELNRRAAESEARLKRPYDAIEAGVADLNDRGSRAGSTASGLSATKPRRTPSAVKPCSRTQGAKRSRRRC